MAVFIMEKSVPALPAAPHRGKSANQSQQPAVLVLFSF